MVMMTGQGRSASTRLQVDLAVDVVQPQLDQLGPLFDQVLMLGDDVTMPATADTDANHRISPATAEESIMIRRYRWPPANEAGGAMASSV